MVTEKKSESKWKLHGKLEIKENCLVDWNQMENGRKICSRRNCKENREKRKLEGNQELKRNYNENSNKNNQQRKLKINVNYNEIGTKWKLLEICEGKWKLPAK